MPDFDLQTLVFSPITLEIIEAGLNFSFSFEPRSKELGRVESMLEVANNLRGGYRFRLIDRLGSASAASVL